MKKQNLTDNLVYVTDKSFQFDLGDNSQQFGIAFEITDMHEATGENEFKDYPFIVSASIVADSPHESFDETGGNPDKASLISDAMSYMGGVPVDHILANSVQGAKESVGLTKDDNPGEFELVTRQFTVMEACVKTIAKDYGTIAAQKGKGTEHTYLQFKTEKACHKFIDYLIKHRISVMSMMIGFTLDRPINMAGDSGWSVMEKMVNGCK